MHRILSEIEAKMHSSLGRCAFMAVCSSKSWQIVTNNVFACFWLFLPFKIIWHSSKYRYKTWWTVISSGLTVHLILAPVTFRSCSPHFTVKWCKPQMLPNFDCYGRQIMSTELKKQCLRQMSPNRSNIWFTGND